jgi:hypothetical protein
MSRVWRAPTEEDKKRECRARNPFEKNPFYVEWNEEYQCWAIAGRSHILVAVSEILSPKEQ